MARPETIVFGGGVAAQTRQALSNMDEVLSRCHVALEGVVFLRILVVATEPEHLGAAWTVVREHFGDHDVPATLQGVSVLGYPGQLVEVEPIAARPPR
ncbi:RidA family protein [Microbacterium sp. NPDC058342]|uniref:RidA family protein n=1 Tax=Microbacterium sp. NPDC058342 TaxID=3346454 RepID=UPI003653268F